MFVKGHKLAKGGARSRAGRPKKAVAEQRKAEKEAAKMVERIAGDMAREYLEKRLKPALDAFCGAASGTGGYEFDAATNRDFIRKFVPDAVRTINVDIQHSAELFYTEIMREQAGPKLLEGKTEIARQ
jgi:hypothetical protein